MQIKPQYEVLFTDLRDHYIGEYLVSRDFKIFMTESKLYKEWKQALEQVERSRGYYALGMDHEPGDACDTLGIYFNEIQGNPRFEHIITAIILSFINWKKEKTDFSDLLQSMEISDFSEKNIQRVKLFINSHEAKEFSKNEVVIKQKIILEAENSKNNIFIVHGHNEEIKHNVARVIEKLKLNPVILHEQSNEGLTIIEKFEKNSNVSFAIVILTFDDYGHSKSTETKSKRARQNVILELGYFLSKLGRGNVMPLYEDGVELPSDISGVLYTKIDESQNWKFRLVKELKTAGFKVDANDLL